VETLWAGAYVGEVIADSQLEGFKGAPGNRGKVCEVGLWAYSRHPNYFFEWLMWVGYALVALFSHPWGWVAFLSPLLMLWLVTKVTGIPPTEAQSLRSRGDAFRDYQRRVSPFVPWKSKKS
jgi:steroid 5-alpha reductase family enzyme